MYSLIIFDLDGTIIDDTIYIWKTLHEHFGSDPVRRNQYHQDYLAGHISYSQWAYSDLDMLKSKRVKKNEIIALFKTLRLIPNARSTLQYLKQKKFRLALISGSVDLALYTALPEAESIFGDIFINKFCFDRQGFLNDIIPTPFDMEHKADGLHFLAKKYNIEKEQIVFVGDNENDLHIAREAGLTIAFNSKSQSLNNIASVVIPGKNLKDILGYIH